MWYVIKGQRNTFATLKRSGAISLFQGRTVSSPLFVLDNQCFERIPIFYQNILQFVHQVTRNIFPLSIKAPCKTDIFDQQILLDADGVESYRLKPYSIKDGNHVRKITLDEIENRFTHADYTAQQLVIFSKRNWTDSINKMQFNQSVDGAAKKFEVAQVVNFQTLQNKHRYVHNFHNNKANRPIISANSLLMEKSFLFMEKSFHLDWRELIDGNYLKQCLIGVIG